MNLLQAVLLFICCVCSRTHAGTIYNATIDALNITNGIEVIFGDTIQIYCQPGQDNYGLYNVPSENDLIDCSQQDRIVVGSCVHSPLSIQINKLPFNIPNIIFYEEGRSYYYAVFQTLNGVFNNVSPCLAGLKFSVNVVAPVTATSASSETATSSTVMIIEPSSSIAESLVSSSEVMNEAVVSVVTSMSVVSRLTNIRSTESTRPVRSTSNIGIRSESTTNFQPVFTRPVVDRVESPSDVAVYSGAAVGGLIFFIVILIVIVIAIGCLVYWKRERSGEATFYPPKGSAEENGTLRPILFNSPTHSIPSEYENDIKPHNHSNGTTFGHPASPENEYENIQGSSYQHHPNGSTENGYEIMNTTNGDGNIDDRTSGDCSNEDDNKCSTMRSISSTEDESIKSSTSRDPLLSPMGGNEQTAFTFNLGTIDEGDSSKLHQSIDCNNDTYL